LGAQALFGVIVVSAWLLFGTPAAALAAAYGAAVVPLGTWLAWQRAIGAPVSVSAAMSRLWIGVLLKWLFVAGALALALAVFKFPPLPLLVGFIAPLFAFFALVRFS
jgi:hypothetical protein